METPSEEDRGQRQDKGGSSERSQRAGSRLSPLRLLDGGAGVGVEGLRLLLPACFESA